MTINITTEPIIVKVATVGLQGIPGSSSPQSTEITFSNSDLTVEGFFVFTHNQNKKPRHVTLWRNNIRVFEDSVSETTLNAIALDLRSFTPLSGAWRLVVDF